MDDPFYQLAAALAKVLGITPLTIVGFIPIIIILANLVSKLIPDDATGWRAWVRKGAALIGLALANRVTSNITTTDVATLILQQKGVPVNPARVDVAVTKLEQFGETTVGAAEPENLGVGGGESTTGVSAKMFPGVGRGADGKFVKLESPLWVALLSLAAVLMLSGCVTERSQAQTYACSHQNEIRLGADVARAKAMQITDSFQRQAALSAIDLGLAALAKCPAPTTQAE